MEEYIEVIGHLRVVIDQAAGPFADEVERVIAADGLCALATTVLADLVDEARSAGVTWLELGEALGVTRQAVYERFRGRAAHKHTRTRLQAEELPFSPVS